MQGSFGVQNKTEHFAVLSQEKLTAAPILGMPRDEGTYYLDTDGYVRTERNYDVTRREL